MQITVFPGSTGHDPPGWRGVRGGGFGWDLAACPWGALGTWRNFTVQGDLQLLLFSIPRAIVLCWGARSTKAVKPNNSCPALETLGPSPSPVSPRAPSSLRGREPGQGCVPACEKVQPSDPEAEAGCAWGCSSQVQWDREDQTHPFSSCNAAQSTCTVCWVPATSACADLRDWV